MANQAEKCQEVSILFKNLGETLAMYYKSFIEAKFARFTDKEKQTIKAFLLRIIGKSNGNQSVIPIAFKRNSFSTLLRLFHTDRQFGEDNINELCESFLNSLLASDLSFDGRCTMTLLKTFKLFPPSRDLLQRIQSQVSSLSPKNEDLHAAISSIDGMLRKMDIDTPKSTVLRSPDECISRLINGDEKSMELIRKTVVAEPNLASNSDIILHLVYSEMFGVILARRFSSSALKRLLQTISKRFVPEDLLIIEFLRFSLFSCFSYMNSDSIMSVLDTIFTECELVGLVRLVAVLPLSSLPVEVSERLIQSILSPIIEILEFSCEHQEHQVFTPICMALVNILAECPESQWLRPSLNRISSIIGNGLLHATSKRWPLLHVARTLFGMHTETIQTILPNCKVTPLECSFALYSISRVDLSARQKDCLLKWLSVNLPSDPQSISSHERVILEHSVACFAQTSSAVGLLELPPLSAFYTGSSSNNVMRPNLLFLPETLSTNPSLQAQPSANVLQRLEEIQVIVNKNPHISDWLDDELERLMVQIQHQVSVIKRG